MLMGINRVKGGWPSKTIKTGQPLCGGCSLFYYISICMPLALCAEKASLVTNDASTLIDWPELDEKTLDKVREKIDTGWESYVKEDWRSSRKITVKTEEKRWNQARRKAMNNRIWKQTDSRWSSNPYPVESSSFGGYGCGCCACVHVAMEQDRYKDWTPENLRSWMIKQGFAIAGKGTMWDGITETLKHIGHSTVVDVDVRSDSMSVAFKELNMGNRIGIILFNDNKAPNGTRWTTATGHFVTYTGYKVENGLHMFYCKDSGDRDHDGWYSYEKSMKGCVTKVWIDESIVCKKVII